MATVAPPAPPPPPADPEYTFTVEQYHRMIETGILSEDEPVELIDGVLVPKMTRKPPHDATLDQLEDELRAILPSGWRLRAEKAIDLSGGEPEPDVAVVLGPASRYKDHHPTPAEIALIGEVADASLVTDRGRKYRAYARAGIPVYWIVNLIDDQIEVYSDPESPPGAQPRYRTRTDYRPGQSVPVVVAGNSVASIPVDEVLQRP